MGEFKTIETQEQFDAAIGERIRRERESVTKQYDGYLSPEDVAKKYEGYLSPEDAAKQKKDYEEKITGLTKDLETEKGKVSNYTKQVAEKDEKIKGYESFSAKTRIAHEKGLSYEAIEFLKGDDEESIRKSADALSSIVGSGNVAPLASPDNAGADNQEMKNLLKGLVKGE